MAGNTAKQRAAGTAAARGRQAAGWLEGDTVTKVGRFGVAGLGVLYLLLAFIAAQVALGGSGESADNTGALQQLAGNGFGKVVLGLLVVAFAGYAIWQAFEAAAGFGHRTGSDRTKKRVVAGVKAAFGAALAVSSVRILTGGGQQSSSQQQADLTGKVLQAPGGQVVVVAAGVAIVAFAGYLAYKGWTKSFLDKLDGPVDDRLERLGQAGYVARGVAFGVLGVLVVIAGVQADPSQARGLDAALKTIAGQPYGKFLLLAVALGLACYGAFKLITARRHREG